MFYNKPYAGTAAMTVGDIDFMLQRYGEDCDPLQFLRELTQNSIEAIQKLPDAKGDILWDYDADIYAQTGVKKLCIIDNGIGMTGDEIESYINGLSSSSGIQSLNKNFGIGSKIAAGVRNPHGMIYQSWKDGVGYVARLWRDPASGKFGLREIEQPDGRRVKWDFITDESKPGLIGRHGTKVILLGQNAEHDTTIAPDNTKSAAKWIRYALNIRYATVPENIKIRVNEGWLADGRAFPVTGQSSYLDNHCQDKGTLPLTDAKAHWWLLKDVSGAGNELEGRGHIAALYQNELFEIKTGPAARAQMQQFGITIGTNQVCIYIEPDEDRTLCNSARRDLMFDKKPLPWLQWANEFEDNMPESLRDFVEALLSNDSQHDYRADIRRRLIEMADLYRFSAYTAIPDGEEDEELVFNPGERNNPLKSKKPNSADPDPATDRDVDNEKSGNPPHNLSGDFVGAGTPHKDKKINDLPIPSRIVWISREKGNRREDHLEDKAAECPRPTTLFINEDFRGFRDLLKLVQKKFKDHRGADSVIEAVVKEYYEANLIEAIIAAQVMAHTSPEPIEITEDFLTAATLPRLNLYNNINRALGLVLGKRHKDPAAKSPAPLPS